MTSTQLNALRHVALLGLIEGISFVVLLGIAMPLKYVWQIPEAVKLVGWAHGLLFVWYLGAIAWAAWQCRWPLERLSLYALSAVVPIAPFFVERALRREIKAAQQAQTHTNTISR
ncbi:DUF3817 domain-containing protein [Eisenibacter elegans]|uniref:DUF3817 domain-containing protein n=1 Tax=Eisenibacter elegans TaxID=997 RepID=UPI000409A2C7|nr:DUF3817 domain-containing protein [Eisenibacter elegans]